MVGRERRQAGEGSRGAACGGEGEKGWDCEGAECVGEALGELLC